MTDIEKQDRIGEMMREYREESRRQAQAASKVRESERDQAAALIASQATRIRDLEEGLTDARKCMRNAMGAIQSNQVVDKQVDQMLRKGMDAADALLSRKGGE